MFKTEIYRFKICIFFLIFMDLTEFFMIKGKSYLLFHSTVIFIMNNLFTEVVGRVAAREMPPFRPAVAARDGQEEDLKELMERCWADVPDERPSFEAVRTVIRRLMKLVI